MQVLELFKKANSRIFLSFDKSKHNFTKNAVMTRYIIYTQEKNVSLFAYVVQTNL